MTIVVTMIMMISFQQSMVESFVIPSSIQHNHHQKKQQKQLSRVYFRQKDDESCQKMKEDTISLGTLTVPSVGIGTISWSCENVLEELELQSLVQTARETTTTPLFDTAERYGGNWKTALGLGWGETEALLQNLIHRTNHNNNNNNNNNNNKNINNKNNVVVATKFTPSPWRTTSKSVVKACQQSCHRLGVNTIDLYQIHMPDIVRPFSFINNDNNGPKDELYWDGIAQCYHDGLIANVGVCNYGPTLLTKCYEALSKRNVPLVSNQIAYSLLGRKGDGVQETVDRCSELGIRVLAYYPFAMGLLTGKYTSDGENNHDDGSGVGGSKTTMSLTKSKKTQLEKLDLWRYANGDNNDQNNNHNYANLSSFLFSSSSSTNIPKGGIRPLLQCMEQIASKNQVSVSQVAINYIISKDIIPIPGARTSAQVQDNMGAMGWRLDKSDVEWLEDVADTLGFGFDGAGFKRTSEKFVGYGVEKWSLN